MDADNMSTLSYLTVFNSTIPTQLLRAHSFFRIPQMSSVEIIPAQNLQVVWFRNIRNCRQIYAKEKLKRMNV